MCWYTGYYKTCVRMAPSSEEITINPGTVLVALEVGVALAELPELPVVELPVVVAAGVLKRSGQLGASRTEP
jgi:hypothetical protein